MYYPIKGEFRLLQTNFYNLTLPFSYGTVLICQPDFLAQRPVWSQLNKGLSLGWVLRGLKQKRLILSHLGLLILN